MFETLEALEGKYEDLSETLGEASVIAVPEKYQEIAKAHAELRSVVEKYREHKSIYQQALHTKKILQEDSDEEILQMAREELNHLEKRRARCEEELKVLLVPRDPNDKKNIILEIRAGTGGDEATLFAQDIFRMYVRYAEIQGWNVEILSVHHSSVSGIKEIIATIEGKNVYSRLKFESGVHRVQRVPETETQGRIHTSAITVAVLPEADEVEVEIDPKEIRVDTFCSSGPGGQSVNTTYSAVRITHIPSGEVVSCQDEKSQIKNKSKAMKVLRSRLYEKALWEQRNKIAENRRNIVGTGDRSEKIRTYNFPQNRLVDHRIKLISHRLGVILEGNLDETIDALVTSNQAETLKNQAIV